MDIFPPAQQRPALLAFADHIDSRPAALRRDECSDWRIAGRRGHIYADGPSSFVLVLAPGSGKAWASAKTTLAPFAILRSDGDDEGTLTMDRLPSPVEGAVLRKVLSIPKRRHLSEDHIAKLREGLSRVALAA